MSETLKPCPFCGAEVHIDKNPLWNGSHGYHGCFEYDIHCGKCGCRVPLPQNDTIYRSDEVARENAITAWNVRKEIKRTTLNADNIISQLHEYIKESDNVDYSRAMVEAIEVVEREKKLCAMSDNPDLLTTSSTDSD